MGEGGERGTASTASSGENMRGWEEGKDLKMETHRKRKLSVDESDARGVRRNDDRLGVGGHRVDGGWGMGNEGERAISEADGCCGEKKSLDPTDDGISARLTSIAGTVVTSSTAPLRLPLSFPSPCHVISSSIDILSHSPSATAVAFVTASTGCCSHTTPV